MERSPIGFKSVFNGRCYYHVVLGMFYNGYFGALGISRRNDLMYKPLEFKVCQNAQYLTYCMFSVIVFVLNFNTSTGIHTCMYVFR